MTRFKGEAETFVVGDYSWESNVSKMLKELGWKDVTDRRDARLVMF